MEVRKSVRFILPREDGKYSECDYHARHDAKESHRRPPLPSVPHRSNLRSAFLNYSSPSVATPKSSLDKGFVCQKHRKQKSSASKKESSSKKSSKGCHHDYEDIDVASSMSQSCHLHSSRAQSASPQLPRRLDRSQKALTLSSSSLIKERSPGSTKIQPLENLKTCSHINSEIIRQRTSIPTLNHYSDSHSVHAPDSKFIRNESGKHSQYYFLPPRDPMLTSFIDSEDVMKRKVKTYVYLISEQKQFTSKIV